MCTPDLKSFLRELPKCEHHIHLEGALTPAVLFRLAAKNSIQLPSSNHDAAFASVDALHERYANFTSLDDFLHYYYLGMSVLVEADDFEALAWDYFQHAAADGIVHAEVFFDPQAHLSRGIAFDTVYAGFRAARARAAAELGISSEVICCFLRHLPAPDCLATFELPELQASLKAADEADGIIGIGLDSSESAYPPSLFRELFASAQRRDLRLTAHAGEEGPASYIASALDDLHVARIDHGIRVVEDPALMARVARDRILLTVCPNSNVFLRCVARIADLPLRELLDAGVMFSINSDDPAYFGGKYLLENYIAVQEAFGWGVVEWGQVCRNAIDGSWCDEVRKAELRARLEAVLRRWKGVLE